jgi:hypothetical protein
MLMVAFLPVLPVLLAPVLLAPAPLAAVVPLLEEEQAASPIEAADAAAAPSNVRRLMTPLDVALVEFMAGEMDPPDVAFMFSFMDLRLWILMLMGFFAYSS